MNPFMLQMMMNPMGMGFMSGCCCSSMGSRNYYNDLSFFNFPVIRNTSYDWLLNPNLALAQCQSQWQNGNCGGFTGMNGIGGFGGFGGFNLPGISNWWNGGNNSNTTNSTDNDSNTEVNDEDTPESAKKKEKINTMKDVFEKFEELTDTSSSDFKALKRQYENALKEENTEDVLKKLEEVFSQIKPATLRKIALADSDIDSKLFLIGYNYPNDTSYKHSIKSPEVDWSSYLVRLNLSDDTSVGELGGAAKADYGRDQILQIISSWNDTHNGDDKGLLRGLAKYLPDSDQDKQTLYRSAVEGLALALIDKATAFVNDNGGMVKFPKLAAQISETDKKLQPIRNFKLPHNKADFVAKIKALAVDFDALYAMLRIQEARVMNKEVISKYSDKMNSIKEGTIPSDIIISETKKDLAAEKISLPADSALDRIPEKESEITLIEPAEKSEGEKIDEETAAKPEEKVKKLAEAGIVEATEGHEGVYQSKVNTSIAPSKHYIITSDNKLVEAKFNSETKTYEKINDTEVSAADIENYKNAVDFIENNKNKITNTKISGLYKSTGKPDGTNLQYFVIMDNKLVKINCAYVLANGYAVFENGTKKPLDKLTAEDVTEVKSADEICSEDGVKEPVVTVSASKTENNTEEEKVTLDTDLSELGINSFSDIKRKHLEKLGLQYTGIDGWYKYPGKSGGYYRYNSETNTIEKLDNVKELYSNGTYLDSKTKTVLPCKQLGKPSDYAEKLNEDLCGITNAEEEISAQRCLNTFLAYDNVEDIVEFLEAYEEKRSFFENKLCEQIYKEYGYFSDSITVNGKEYKSARDYYIIGIAQQLLEVADATKIGDDVYKKIQKIANGDIDYQKLIETSPLLEMDRLIEEVLKIYRKEQPKEQQTETESEE